MTRGRAFGFALFLSAVVLAACSGNIGGGSSAVPGAPPVPPGPLAHALASPTGTPNSASGTITVSASGGPQTLPNVGGFTASVAFPATSASPTTMSADSALVAPSSAPVLGTTAQTGGKKHGFLGIGKGGGKRSPYRALLYVTLIATRTVTFDRFPQFTFGVPVTIVAALGDVADLELALYDPTQKAKQYKLAVAERIQAAAATPTASGSASAAASASGSASASPTGSPTASPTPSATPAPSPSASGASPKPSGSGSPAPKPAPSPSPAPSVALVAVGFQSPQNPFTMQADKAYVFVLYAVVAPTPEATGSPGTAAESRRRGGARPGVSASALPAPLESGVSAPPAPPGSANASPAASPSPGSVTVTPGAASPGPPTPAGLPSAGASPGPSPSRSAATSGTT